MNMKILLLIFIQSFIITQITIAQDTTGLAISHQKFQKQMKKRNTVVLDVRTLDEYKTGFIGNAINYNVMDSLSFVTNISSLDKEKKYLLYCKSGRRSGKALVMMKKMGFQNVHHLRGGVTDWKGDLKKPE